MQVIDAGGLDPSSSPFPELRPQSGGGGKRKLAIYLVLLATVVGAFVIALLMFIGRFTEGAVADGEAAADAFAAAVVDGWDAVGELYGSGVSVDGFGAYFGGVSAAERVDVNYYTRKHSDRTRQDDESALEALVWIDSQAGPALIHLDFLSPGLTGGPWRVTRLSEVGPDFVRLELDEQRTRRLEAAVADRGGLYPFGEGLAGPVAEPERPPVPAQPQPPAGRPAPGSRRVARIRVLDLDREVAGLPNNSGIRFTGVRVRVCATRRSGAVSPDDLFLVDDAGARYGRSPLGRPTPQLEPVKAGACGRGWLTYGALRDNRPEALVYAPGGVDAFSVPVRR